MTERRKEKLLCTECHWTTEHEEYREKEYQGEEVIEFWKCTECGHARLKTYE